MRKPHLSAEVYFLPTAEGGRSSPICSGYRGQFHHNGGENIADVEWSILDDVCIYPCLSGNCQVCFIRPKAHLPSIKTGDDFEIREGKQVIATGKILSIISNA